jgi:putative redox protein
MKHQVKTVWLGGMRFNALVNGHTIVMDAPERAGGNNEGTIPKPLMLTALSGCTGMDVVSLLRKEGHTLKSFDLRVSGELGKDVPMVYTSAHIIYETRGNATLQDDVLRAVQRSQNDLCGASAMLKKAMPVTWEVHFNGKLIYSNKSGKLLVALG